MIESVHLSFVQCNVTADGYVFQKSLGDTVAKAAGAHWERLDLLPVFRSEPPAAMPGFGGREGSTLPMLTISLLCPSGDTVAFVLLLLLLVNSAFEGCDWAEPVLLLGSHRTSLLDTDHRSVRWIFLQLKIKTNSFEVFASMIVCFTMHLWTILLSGSSAIAHSSKVIPQSSARVPSPSENLWDIL